MASRYEEAFVAFSQFREGLTRPEFEALMDSKEDKRCASARLSQFVKEGLAEIRGTSLNPETGQMCKVYVPTGLAFSKRALEDRKPSRRRRRPTDNELVELRAWKASALERFPELAVSKAILRSRIRWAEMLRAEGQVAKAVLVERGEFDDTETMKVLALIVGGGE